MTTREQLNKHRQRAFFIALPGFVMFVGGTMLTQGQGGPSAVFAIGGFVLFAGGMLFLVLGARCLQCKQHLGQMFYQGSLFGAISQDLHYCPYCGKSLDDASAQEA